MTARRRGRLIAVEGIDGSGKSTLVRALARVLRRDGWSVTVSSEPNDPVVGRSALAVSARDPWRAAAYFTLDRLAARPELERALATHDFVFLDRSFYSTLAYQGSALPARRRAELAAWQRRVAVAPDLVFWVRLSVDSALERVRRRGRARASTERRRILEQVDRAYARLSRDRRWVTLEGDRSPRELVEDARGRVVRRWPRRARGRGRR